MNDMDVSVLKNHAVNYVWSFGVWLIVILATITIFGLESKLNSGQAIQIVLILTLLRPFDFNSLYREGA